ncbi:MAG: CdaR family protein [Oscillospiraceae bacterium]|nr:CdaR family protein [Oscillospiraceae bacterium]
MNRFLYSIKRNIKSMVLALAASVVIWFAISLQIFPDVVNSVENLPVSIEPTIFMEENNLSVAKGSDFNVTARVEGKRYDIGNLRPEEFSAYLDLSSITGEGQYEVPVKVNLNKDVDGEVYPDVETVAVNVVRIAEKTLTIEPLAAGIIVSDGFEVDSENLKVTPPTVTFKGEARYVDAITRAVVRVENNTEITSTTEMRGEIILYNNNAVLQEPEVELDNSDFNVTLAIHKVKTLPTSFSITGYQSNFNISNLLDKIVVHPTEITISSPDNSIDSLDRIELAQINISELDYFALRTPRRETIAPILPPGYRNISMNSSVSLNFEGIEDYGELIFTVFSADLKIINPPSDFDARVLTDALMVNVVGPLSFLQELTPEDITATVNLMGLEHEDGTRRVNVTCRIEGSNVPAWVSGNPQVDIMFTRR